MKCVYVYNGRNGGRKGQQCGRPEADHCKGRAEHFDESHDDACKLLDTAGVGRGVKVRPMVHHPFHRPSAGVSI